jgi:hypothetical protein
MITGTPLFIARVTTGSRASAFEALTSKISTPR